MPFYNLGISSKETRARSEQDKKPERGSAGRQVKNEVSLSTCQQVIPPGQSLHPPNPALTSRQLGPPDAPSADSCPPSRLRQEGGVDPTPCLTLSGLASVQHRPWAGPQLPYPSLHELMGAWGQGRACSAMAEE